MNKKIKRIQGKVTNIENRLKSDIQKIGVPEEKKQSKEIDTIRTFATIHWKSTPYTWDYLEQPTSEKL